LRAFGRKWTFHTTDSIIPGERQSKLTARAPDIDILTRFAPLNRRAAFMPLQRCRDSRRRSGMNAALSTIRSWRASTISQLRIWVMNRPTFWTAAAKRSATPLSSARRGFETSTVPVRSKAPSTLRSAGAVHDAGGTRDHLTSLQALSPIARPDPTA
jgi:hypothetical protein